MNEPEGKLTLLDSETLYEDTVGLPGKKATIEMRYAAAAQLKADEAKLKDIMGQVFKELESKKFVAQLAPDKSVAGEVVQIEDIEALKSKWGIK